MTITAFRDTHTGKSIFDKLEAIKQQNNYDYISKDMQAAVFYAYVCLTNEDRNEKYVKKLDPFVRHYHDVIKYFLTEYLKTDAGDFDLWVLKHGFLENMLKSYQYVGMATPTYAHNKNLIH